MRQVSRAGFLGVLVALLASMLTGCHAGPPDRREQAGHLAERIRALPGVRSADDDVEANVPRDDVHFWLSVDVADTATADEVAAVTRAYLEDLRDTGYPGYLTELDIRCDSDRFAVDASKTPPADADGVVAQSREWVALRSQLNSATVDFRANSQQSIATITLRDPADYRDVGAAFSVLASRFADLSGDTWSVSAGTAHPAVITTSKRYPTAAELAVWNTLNSDQSVPHIDAMAINAPTTAPLWISEKTLSRDPALALRLAVAHLPVVATLPPVVLYTATDKLQAHRTYDGHAAGPVAVTIGGCTVRTYRPDAAEQKLIDTYEACKSHPSS